MKRSPSPGSCAAKSAADEAGEIWSSEYWAKKGDVPLWMYRKRLGVVPWIELAIGCYFAWTVYYAVTTENFFTVPFLVLFVFGYWYTGLLSLLQGRFERSSDSGQRMHEKPYPVGV